MMKTFKFAIAALAMAMAWNVSAHAGHIVSKNASSSESATLVVFPTTGAGEPIASPR